MRNGFKNLARAFVLLFLATPCSHAADGELVIAVDKKQNQLHMARYRDGRLEPEKTFRATMGQRVGDKMIEGDLRTPEGIYEFLFRTQAPALKPMFGPLAVYVSYPNVMDKNGQKTGFDILIHGTDDPSRLEKKFDSKGCVVLDNENVKIVSDAIRLKDTKIVITRDFDAIRNPARLPRAREFFQRWITAWSGKDLDTYVDSYADEFKMDGMNRAAFAKYKDSLNKKYGSIKVTASDVMYLFHEKYDLIAFTQHYDSTMANGAPAYRGTSKKQLWIQERNGHYKIVVEESLK
ncbi:MAG: L,D-transpeptidase family protein [Bdellovibrionales bacterium]|nr:L,D-transpeptidase family protein [Bdellovibrionales bacterium]